MDPRPLLFHKIMIHFSYANTLVAIWYHTIQTLTKQGSGLWRLHFIYCWYLSIGSPWQSIHSPRQHLDSRQRQLTKSKTSTMAKLSAILSVALLSGASALAPSKLCRGYVSLGRQRTASPFIWSNNVGAEFIIFPLMSCSFTSCLLQTPQAMCPRPQSLPSMSKRLPLTQWLLPRLHLHL